MVSVRPHEASAAVLSCLYFFCLLAANNTLKPLRDAMGIAGDATALPWLYLCTLAGMVLLNPVFGWLASKLPRRIFIPLVYHFFAFNLIVLYVLLQWTGHVDSGGLVAKAFFVWASVFNLFAVSVFWGFMADVWTTEQGARIFGFIGAGGTLGAILGSTITASLVQHIGPVNLILVAVGLLELAVVVVMLLLRLFRVDDLIAERKHRESPSTLARGGAFGGIMEVIRSRFLLAICLYMLFFTISSTFLYFEQGKIVKEAFPDTATRAAAYARIDLWANIITIAVQFLLTGHIIRWCGIGFVLALLPIVTMGGVTALAIWPVFGVLVVVQVVRRAVDYSLARPAREVLYTAVTREEKYKAKTLIDTFVYRGGDALAAFASDGISRAGLGLVAIAGIMAPIGVLWAGVAVYLGVKVKSMLKHRHEPIADTAPAPNLTTQPLAAAASSPAPTAG